MKLSPFQIYLGVSLLIIIIVSSATLLTMYSSVRSAPSYVGSSAVLTDPKQSVSLQIDQAVLATITPKLPSGVQANIKLSAFTNSAAIGSISYNNTYSTEQFMVVKLTNKQWKVIDYTKDKTLSLPNRAIASKYKLPKGWYSNA
jgi:hypothetical protein